MTSGETLKLRTAGFTAMMRTSWFVLIVRVIWPITLPCLSISAIRIFAWPSALFTRTVRYRECPTLTNFARATDRFAETIPGGAFAAGAGGEAALGGGGDGAADATVTAPVAVAE